MTPTAQIEAALFAHGEAMTKKRLATLLGVDVETLQLGLDKLHGELAGRGIALVETPEQVELRTAPDATEIIKKLREGELSRDLGRAGLEALAVVMYRKDGATRSEIDWIRGVNSSAIVRSLLLRGLVERSEDPSDKRKLRYKATTDALAHLALERIEELPRFNELSHEAGAAIAAAESGEPNDTNHGDA